MRRLDAAFVGEAVLLPTEAFIGDQARIVDVEGIHRRREAARLAIAKGLEAEWWAAYRRWMGSGTALTPEAKGARRLANVALAYLVTAGSAEAIAAAKTQYDGAVTMTDRMGALTALINTDTPERDACLADFHARFDGNNDVIDKWFTVQALSQRPDTLGAGRKTARPQGLQPDQSQPVAVAGRRLFSQPASLPCRGRRGLSCCSPTSCSPSIASTRKARRAWWCRSGAGGALMRRAAP